MKKMRNRVYKCGERTCRDQPIMFSNQYFCPSCRMKNYMSLRRYIVKEGLKLVAIRILITTITFGVMMLIASIWFSNAWRWGVLIYTIYIALYLIYLMFKSPRYIAANYEVQMNQTGIYGSSRAYLIQQICCNGKTDEDKYQELLQLSEFYDDDILREARISYMNKKPVIRYGKYETESLCMEKYNKDLADYLYYMAGMDITRIGKKAVLFFYQYCMEIRNDFTNGMQMVAKILFIGLPEFTDDKNYVDTMKFYMEYLQGQELKLCKRMIQEVRM